MSDFEPKKLAIIRLLQILEQETDSDHPMTQEELLKRLEDRFGIELERKAVGRSISYLQEMFDKEAMQNPTCAITLTSEKRRGTYMERRLFDDTELRLLIDGVLACKHINAKYTEDLIEKLCSLSNVYFRSHIKHISSVKEWDKTDNAALFLNIMIVDEAIEKGRQIQFDYNKYGFDKKLHVTHRHIASPYQLIMHNQKYYLVHFNEGWGNVGYFRLDKMTNMSILDDKPLTPMRSVKGFKNGVDYRKIANMPYLFTDEPTRVEFIAEDWLIDQIIDWFGSSVTLKKAEDGKVRASVTVSENAMEYWALQYLKYVEIVSPSSLRDKIKENIANAMEKYK